MTLYDNCRNLYRQTVTIPTGAGALSDGFATQGYALVGIIMPAGWVAADIGFQTSDDGVNFKAVSSGGNYMTAAVKVDTGVPQNMAFPEADQAFAPFLKLSSVTAGTKTAVDQTADRALICVFRKLFS